MAPLQNYSKIEEGLVSYQQTLLEQVVDDNDDSQIQETTTHYCSWQYIRDEVW